MMNKFRMVLWVISVISISLGMTACFEEEAPQPQGGPEAFTDSNSDQADGDSSREDEDDGEAARFHFRKSSIPKEILEDEDYYTDTPVHGLMDGQTKKSPFSTLGFVPEADADEADAAGFYLACTDKQVHQNNKTWAIKDMLRGAFGERFFVSDLGADSEKYFNKELILWALDDDSALVTCINGNK